MKKESSTNLQKYSGIAEQMIKMLSDCPETTKNILDIIYGDEGEGNGISTISQTAQRLRNPGQKRLRKACTEKKNIIYLKQKSISRDGQKVIIENSRGLRLGFFIELAEYFIFFIFKLLCVHKDEKQIFCICMKTRNSNESHPGIYFRIGVSPHDKTNLFTIQNSRNHEKN